MPSRTMSNSCYTTEWKLELKRMNPCRTKKGKVTDHKSAHRKDCLHCLVCKHPPWCTSELYRKENKIVTPKYQRGGKKRVPDSSTLRIGGLESPAKKLRAQTPATTPT